jgi:cadmium resistance protein CadD (predicted permease)
MDYRMGVGAATFAATCAVALAIAFSATFAVALAIAFSAKCSPGERMDGLAGLQPTNFGVHRAWAGWCGAGNQVLAFRP